MFEKLFDKDKENRKLRDIKISEISLVDKPANNCRFLIEKLEAGETFNDLDELISCEAFTDEQAEQIDEIMKWLDLDDDTTSAIGDLLLAINSQPDIAKSCEESWPSINRQVDSVIDIPCLIKKSELNLVDVLLQSFVSKAALQSDEIEIISKALEIISDLDEISLQAVYDLLKISFSEETLTHKWPSLFKHIEVETQPVKKTGLKWPSIVSQI